MSSKEVLAFGGVEYDVSELPSNIKDLVACFNLSNKKLGKARNELHIYEMACASYAALIKRKIEEFENGNDVL